MTAEVCVEYQRDDGAETSSGNIVSRESGMRVEEASFQSVGFREMLTTLARVLGNWELDTEVSVVLVRTDHPALTPYTLDKATVTLLRTDPVAAIQALEFHTTSPSTVAQRVAQSRTTYVQAPLKVGHAVLADAFGENLYFKVRGHELECPGCGFWGVYASPGLLADPERAGAVFKTVFVCPKKCHARFAVTCEKDWGYVSTTYLLKNTKLDAFYFPRAWNEGRPWVSRESLQKKFDEYFKEKESV